MTIFSGYYTSTINLTKPPVTNPVTITGTVNVAGNGVNGLGIAWNVSNFGTVETSGSGAGSGIALYAGGSVANGSNAAQTALINAYGDGIDIYNKAGTVSNFGTVAGGSNGSGNGDGVYMGAGGTVTNGSTVTTSASISGYGAGIEIDGGAAKVVNFGTVQGAGDYGAGVYVGRSGSVTNGAVNDRSALIQGSYQGVYLGSGSVANFGTIIDTGGIISPSVAGPIHAAKLPFLPPVAGVVFGSGGAVTNGSATDTSATINGALFGVEDRTAAGKVSNFGTIHADFAGVALFAGGSVTNGSVQSTVAYIYGQGIGITALAAASIVNFGTVAGSTEGVYLGSGGTLVNGTISSTAALISGGNAGVATGVDTVSTVTNFGSINGGVVGVALWSGLLNNGAKGSTGAHISGYAYGVKTVYGSISNFGTILGTGSYSSGLYVEGSAHIANGVTASTAALISGANNGIFSEQGGTVANFGTVEGFNSTSAGIYFQGGGLINNGAASSHTALIAGSSYGLELQSGATTVNNFGTIIGGTGIYVGSGDTDAVSITNAGVIDGAGGTAVQFGGSDGQLTVDAGATFVGFVDGNGSDTLVFNVSGALSMADFVGFDTVNLIAKSGANQLAVTDANFASGQTSLTVQGGNHGNTLDASATTQAVTLLGGPGADTLIAGSDTTMAGSAGHNEFEFTTTGTNTVTDFKHVLDQLVFPNSDFDLGSDDGHGTATPQQIAADLFVSNSTGSFTTTAQRFAFDTATHQLFYSPNGSAGTAELVSNFNGNVLLTAHDLYYTS